eukprot:TRINITY_DN50066_c0_g1_i1.p1 TRINITY_DN50066_c0_g1~~TRINITY_DN50066_c0_g1_i1.p1  ORF type:complete len:1116 (-),score=305.05 TRINITY_DN50066_c0_g1_i1:30-3377(-)
MAGWVSAAPRPLEDSSKGVWAQLLEQASDLNDELCRENCELHREVSVLRQRRLERLGQCQQGGSSSSRATRARVLLPRVMSNVRRAVRDLPLPDVPGAEGLPAAIEDAVRGVVVSMAELERGEAAFASSEETAALIAEKVALKEFSMRQQERLLELELAREKLSLSMPGLWASRLTSAFQGTLSEPSSSSTAPPPSRQVPKEATPPPVQHSIAPGDMCEVVGRKGAILRETEDLESAQVATIPPGSRVRILEVGASSSRRALVQVIEASEAEPLPAQAADSVASQDASPVGWLSVSTKDGKALVRPLLAGGEAPSRKTSEDPKECHTEGGPSKRSEDVTREGAEGSREQTSDEIIPEPETTSGGATEQTSDELIRATEADNAGGRETTMDAKGIGEKDAGREGGRETGLEEEDEDTAPREAEAGDAVNGRESASDDDRERRLRGGSETSGDAEERSSREVEEAIGAETEQVPQETEAEASEQIRGDGHASSDQSSERRPDVMQEDDTAPEAAQAWTRQADSDKVQELDEERLEMEHQEQPQQDTEEGLREDEAENGDQANDQGVHDDESGKDATERTEVVEERTGHDREAAEDEQKEVLEEKGSHGEDMDPAPEAYERSNKAKNDSSSGASKTVTVSTDAWLALRHERTQRERQIKALQAQVDSAQKELRQLDEVRAQLREQRSLALEARRRGNEFQEAALMAAEDLSSLRWEAKLIEDALLQKRQAEEAEERRRREEEEAREKAAREAAEKGTEDTSEDEGDEATRLQWQRLLSERETTARELGLTLQRVEEMEKEIEERHIELQIAERRRERERRSLLTALRELGGRRTGGGGPDNGVPAEDTTPLAGQDEGDASPGWVPLRSSSFTPSSSSTRPPNQQESSAESPGTQDEERQFLQRISELEDTAARLQEQIDAVQSRVATLNRRAVTRQQALRYASSSSVVGGIAEAVETAVSGIGLSGSTGRSDLDALTEMLDRLFVENFALRRLQRGAETLEVSKSSSSSSFLPASGPIRDRRQVLSDPVPFDLSRFVLGEGANSDEEGETSAVDVSSADQLARPKVFVNAERPQVSLLEHQVPSASSESGSRKSSSPLASPRTRLFGGLDFKALSVAE